MRGLFRRGTWSETPILIPAFNNPSYCRMMVNQLFDLGLSRMVIIDNASTTEEMKRELLALEERVHVIRLGKNAGPKYFARNWLFYVQLPQIFCVTDPDLAFNDNLPNDFLENLFSLTNEHGIGKAGFALDIQDYERFREIKLEFKGKPYDIVSWERQFWQRQIGLTKGLDPVFLADIDTTFALYNKKHFVRRKSGFYRALRVAGNFTARHLPWYSESLIGRTEEIAYAKTQKFSWYSNS
jgi:hypothetical protein